MVGGGVVGKKGKEPTIFMWVEHGEGWVERGE